VITPSGRVDPEKKIGEHVYRCGKLRGEDVLDVMVLMIRTLAPIAGEDVVASALSGQALDTSGLGKSLPEILRQLRAEDVQDLRKRLAQVTEVRVPDGWVPLDRIFGEHFAGRPAEILQWMLHAFAVSCPLFFSVSPPSPAADAQPPVPEASRSPSTSRTSSGGR
jgi:hypothetical protein